MIKIYPAVFKGTLKAPASKAHAQRLLFAASMPSTPTLVTNVPVCEDVNTALDTLIRLGCKIAKGGEGEILVDPFPKNIPRQSVDFNFKSSATTARIAMSLCAALGISACCNADDSLTRRQELPLISRMALRGEKFSSFSFPLEMTGRLEPGDYAFRGDEGSQFISSIMYALPLLPSDSKINLDSPLVDDAFIKLTVDTLKNFGITIEETDYGFFVPGRQYYSSPNQITAENDWGLASMWIAAAAACSHKGGRMTVTNLPKFSPQAYRDLKPMLALISQDFLDLNLDCSSCPGLTSLLTCIAAVKGATIRISGIPQLKFKETNQFKSIGEIASFFDAKTVVTEDSITLIGNPDYHHGPNDVLDCKGDPWIFMGYCLASPFLKCPVVLSDENCAAKIYGRFIKDYSTVGGRFEIIK